MFLSSVWVRFTSKEPGEWKVPLSVNANKVITIPQLATVSVSTSPRPSCHVDKGHIVLSVM